MKNLGTLYCYELKKLLRRPLTWVVAILLTAASVYFAQHDLMTKEVFSYIGDNGELVEEEVPSTEWMLRLQEGGQALNGTLMDDAFFQAMGKALPDLEDGAIRLWCYEEDHTYGTIFVNMGGFLTVPRNCTAEEFYAIRRDLIEEHWDYLGLTDVERTYWTEQEDRLTQPFVYYEPWAGFGDLCSSIKQLLSLIPLATAICLCSIFSEDRSRRMEALVFISRECRLPLYLVKLLAGFTGTALMAMIVIGGYMAAEIFAWGTKGWNASLQMLDLFISWPVSVGHATTDMLLVLMLFAILCGTLTMLISVLTRSTIAALVVPVIMMSWLTGQYPHTSRLAFLLPQFLLDWSGVRNLWLNGGFGLYLNGFQTFFLLCIILVLALSILCWLGWQRNATCGK